MTLYASMTELRAYEGARIDKIQQPEKDELLLTLRAGGSNPKLLISASAMNCRLQLTNTKRPNPVEPPMFCMLLRKRIAGGRIVSVSQPEHDRVVDIKIEAQNELGDMERYTLYAEIMGKHSNIILAGENGVILDSIRRVGPGVSNKRLVLPGLGYERPPRQDKRAPDALSEEDLYNIIASSERPNKQLSNEVFGLSPQMAESLIESLGGAQDGRALAKRLYDYYIRLDAGEFEPYSLLNEFSEPAAVFPFRPSVRAEACRRESSLHEALDAFYAQSDISARMQRHGASIRRILQNNQERCEKKLSMYSEALHSDEDIERTRLFGELITANLHAMKHGAFEAVLMNYYEDPPAPLIVPLEPQLSPNENAQRYYKKYQKLRSARDMAKTQLEETRAELDYIDALFESLTKCTTDTELEELRAELTAAGYIRPEKGKKQKKLPQSKPLRFISSDGIEILVGKNNTQNDYITLRVADLDDYWFHTKDIPGSHVIVRSSQAEPPRATMEEAALLAAYYSKARGGENIAVDFTKRRNVKKPSGAKPGMVIYLTNRTAYVTPDEACIKRIAPAT